MPYRTLNKMTDEKRQTIQRDGQMFFKALDNNEEV
jgi:deoxyribodipyrimidine photolyase-related protein